MTEAKSITVIVPWCRRPELARTLCLNRVWIGKFVANLVIANCAGDADWLHANIVPIEGMKISVLNIYAKTFNKALSINMGLAFSQTQFVLLLDADVILDDFLQNALSLCDAKSFVTLERLNEFASPDIVVSEILRYGV